MSREQIYQEIEHTMGLVPSMFKAVPDATLELEWQLFKADLSLPIFRPNGALQVNKNHWINGTRNYFAFLLDN